MSPEQFQPEQARISAVESKASPKVGRVEKELATELKNKHEVFFAKVNETQLDISKAGKLTSPAAKSRVEKEEKNIKSALLTAASTGEAILAAKADNPDVRPISTAADKIKTASYDVKNHIEFFTDLEAAQGTFEKTCKPLIDAIKKNAESRDSFDRKKYLADITKALGLLGDGGMLGNLQKIEKRSYMGADFKSLLETVSQPVKDSIKELTDMKIKDMEQSNYEFEVDKNDPEIKFLKGTELQNKIKEIKERKDTNLKLFLEVKRGSGAFNGTYSLGFDSINTYLSSAYSFRDRSINEKDSTKKKSDLDTMKEQAQNAKDVADKVFPGLSKVKRTDLPVELQPMLSLMLNDCKTLWDKANNIESTIDEAGILEKAKAQRTEAFKLMTEAWSIEGQSINMAPNYPDNLIKAYDQALFGVDGSGGMAGMIKLVRDEWKLPEQFRIDSANNFNEKNLKYFKDRKVQAEQQKVTFDPKYTAYVRMVLDRKPGDKTWPGFGEKMKLEFTPAFDALPPEKQNEVRLAILGAKIGVEEQLEAATSPKVTEKFWAAKSLYEFGNFEQARELMNKFLKEDLPQLDSDPKLKSQKANYERRAKAILDQLEKIDSGNKDFFEAQKLLDTGDIVNAKIKLKKYLKEHEKPKEGETSFSGSAKELLRRIGLIQLQEAKSKFVISAKEQEAGGKPLFEAPSPKRIRYEPDKNDPERKGMIAVEEPNPEYAKYQKYMSALTQIETMLTTGKEVDFTEAYNKVSADLAKEPGGGLNPKDDYNVLNDQVILDQGEEGYLQLARKYRQKSKAFGDSVFGDSKYDAMAEQYFNHYFGKELKQNQVTVESVRQKYGGKMDSFYKVGEIFEKDKDQIKANYDEACKKDPTLSSRMSWTDYQIASRKRIETAFYESLVSEETRFSLNGKFQGNKGVMGDKQGAWGEYMSMKGMENQGKWTDTFTLSDAEIRKCVSDLPVDIAMIAAAGALAAATGGAASGLILEAGMGIAEREAAQFLISQGAKELIVRSGLRQAAAWGVGLVTETTVFTISHSTLNAIRTGELSIATWPGFRDEWLGNLKVMGGLGLVGRASQALELGAVSSFGVEMAAMGNLNGGKLTMDDWSMVLGLKIAHAVPDAPGKVVDTVAKAKEKIADYKDQEGMKSTKEALDKQGITGPESIKGVIVAPDGFLYVTKPDNTVVKLDPSKVPAKYMPENIQAEVAKQSKEYQSQKMEDKLAINGIKEPTDIVSVNDGKMVTKDGKLVEITDPEHLPVALKFRYEELRRAEVKDKATKYGEANALVERYNLLNKDPVKNSAELAKTKAALDAKAKEIGTTAEKLMAEAESQSRLYRTLDSIYSNQKEMFSESKIIKKPIFNEDGTPKLDANNQPMFEEINLFKEYNSKTYAYSKEFIADLNYEKLKAEGGCKVIKLGGDELLVLHAGPEGTVQQLFIDISNMGPTNNTATTLAGNKINLVDIYLLKISDSIKAQSKANAGKYLDAGAFNAKIADATNALFNLDRGTDGKPLDPKVAEANFDKLKKEWNLDGDFAKYKTDVDSMRILAEFRSDTRGLDSSFKGKKGVTFGEHITGEIEKISGMKLEKLVEMMKADPKLFKELIEKRRPKSDKINAMSAEAEYAEMLKLDSKSSPEDLMMMYSLMARVETANLPSGLSANLAKTRVEMVGEPPHPRVEEPRLMDAKVVSIDIPKPLADALAKMSPVEAQSIMVAARTLAEKPLDSLKYSKDKSNFAKFNIMDHVEIVDGKVKIKQGAKEFTDAYKVNIKDKKVVNIVEIQEKITAVKRSLEDLRQKYEKGGMDKATFEAQLKANEKEIRALEDKICTDPDTGAYNQAYMDVKPTRMYLFPDGIAIPEQHRIWDSTTADLSHAGVINSKYGYLGMDKIMSAVYKVLQSEISSKLPADLQHFKIIRAGGGKFEVVFLDQRSVNKLSEKGTSPEILIKNIVEGPGQESVNKILSADPEAQSKSLTDAAVRDAQFKYNIGGESNEVGKLTTKSGGAISGPEIMAVLNEFPNISQRGLIGEVMKRRAAAAKPEGSSTGAPAVEFVAGSKAPKELYNSSIDGKVPKELPPGTEGWIDPQGKIHYNLETIKSKLAPGYTMEISEKGTPMIKSPKGEFLTLHSYEKAVKGTAYEGTLLTKMVEVKVHEVTHRVLEFSFTKVEIGTDGTPRRVEDSAKTKPVLDLFGEPSATGDAAGKIPLLDQNGKPMKVTWENVQEYLSHVADGSIQVSKSRAEFLEKVIASQIPDFKFTKVRTIDTKLIADPANARSAFSREKYAPKEGEVVKKITGSDEFNQALGEEKGQVEKYKMAHQILTDLMGALRSGDPAQVELVKSMAEPFVDRKVLDKLVLQLPQMKEGLAAAMSTPKGLSDLMALEKQGKLTAASREVLKQMIKEGKVTKELLSPTEPDGKPKSKAKIAEDLAQLRQEISYGTVELNPYITNQMAQSPEGVKIIAEQPHGTDILRKQIFKGDLKIEGLPPEVKQKLTEEFHKKFLDSLQYIDNPDLRTSISLEFSPEKLAEALQKLHDNPLYKKYPDLPSPEEIILSGADNLPPLAIAKLLRGNVEFNSVELVRDGKITRQSIMVVEGKSIGDEGGFGKVYQAYAYEGRGSGPQEVVTKKFLTAIDITQTIDYQKLSPSNQAKVNQIIADLKFDGTVSRDSLSKAQRELGAIVGSERILKPTNPFNKLLEFKYNSYLELRNSKIIMELQAKGEMKGFMGVKYLSPDGSTLIYENLATKGEVKSYKSILNGKSDATPAAFWGGVADVIVNLKEAHAKGLIHNDIKPHNIIIGPDGKAKIIDYGTFTSKSDLPTISFLADGMPPEAADMMAAGGFMDPYAPMTTGGPRPYSPDYLDTKKGYTAFKNGKPESVDMQMLSRSIERDLMAEAPPEVKAKFMVPPEFKKAIEDFASGAIDADTFETIIRKYYK